MLGVHIYLVLFVSYLTSPQDYSYHQTCSAICKELSANIFVPSEMLKLKAKLNKGVHLQESVSAHCSRYKFTVTVVLRLLQQAQNYH